MRWLALLFLLLLGECASGDVNRHGCRLKEEYDTCGNLNLEVVDEREIDSRPVCFGLPITFEMPHHYRDAGSTYFHVLVYWHPSKCPPIYIERPLPTVFPVYFWEIWRDEERLSSGKGTRAEIIPGRPGEYRHVSWFVRHQRPHHHRGQDLV